MTLIIGLGNPGEKYTLTRHNAGFLVIDELAKRLSVSLREKSALKAEVAEANENGNRIILSKPTTFMNKSGEAVSALMRKYNIATEDVWIIVDDIDLSFGQLRTRKGGSAGTHNGLKSVLAHTGSDEFTRFRIGVNPPPEKWDLADWVLSKFSKEEQNQLPAVINGTADEILNALATKPNETTRNLLSYE